MSIIRPFQRLSRGPILIALSAGIAAAVLVPAAAAGPKLHHLEFHLSGSARQDIVGTGAIKIRARCVTEACTVVASAISKQPSIRTGEAHATVRAGGAATLTLPLSPRRRGKLKAALQAGRSPTFTVSAIARDQAGTKVQLALEVHPQKR